MQATLAAKMFGKKWIGQRRSADVVAATNVECLVLGKREMQWAIKHDEDVAEELRKDIRNRKLQTESAASRSVSMNDNPFPTQLTKSQTARRSSSLSASPFSTQPQLGKAQTMNTNRL